MYNSESEVDHRPRKRIKPSVKSVSRKFSRFGNKQIESTDIDNEIVKMVKSQKHLAEENNLNNDIYLYDDKGKSKLLGFVRNDYKANVQRQYTNQEKRTAVKLEYLLSKAKNNVYSNGSFL